MNSVGFWLMSALTIMGMPRITGLQFHRPARRQRIPMTLKRGERERIPRSVSGGDSLWQKSQKRMHGVGSLRRVALIVVMRCGSVWSLRVKDLTEVFNGTIEIKRRVHVSYYKLYNGGFSRMEFSVRVSGIMDDPVTGAVSR